MPENFAGGLEAERKTVKEGAETLAPELTEKLKGISIPWSDVTKKPARSGGKA